MRIVADIVILFAVFLTPWWFAMLAASLFSFFFRNYLEIIIAGLIIDSVWGDSGVYFFDFQLVAFGIATIIFLLSAYIRSRLSARVLP